jgi:hypothetical protein
MSDDLAITLLLLLIIWWLGASVAVSRAAGSRGQNSGPWFWLSLFLGPFLAALLLLAYPPAQAFDRGGETKGSLSITGEPRTSHLS